ncbi:MAG: hypothetical protein AAF611_02440 [Bacteroidota bacterium]
MKRRNIKSLELNKKTISTVKTTNIKGGVTSSYYCVIAATVAIEDFVEGFVDGWNASGN